MQGTKSALIPGQLKDIINGNKYITVDSEVRIYQTTMKPISTYEEEIWSKTIKAKQIIRATEDQVRENCGIIDVLKGAPNKGRHWRDHVKRMDKARLTKTAGSNFRQRLIEEEYTNGSIIS